MAGGITLECGSDIGEIDINDAIERVIKDSIEKEIVKFLNNNDGRGD